MLRHTVSGPSPRASTYRGPTSVGCIYPRTWLLGGPCGIALWSQFAAQAQVQVSVLTQDKQPKGFTGALGQAIRVCLPLVRVLRNLVCKGTTRRLCSCRSLPACSASACGYGVEDAYNSRSVSTIYICCLSSRKQVTRVSMCILHEVCQIA